MPTNHKEGHGWRLLGHILQLLAQQLAYILLAAHGHGSRPPVPALVYGRCDFLNHGRVIVAPSIRKHAGKTVYEGLQGAATSDHHHAGHGSPEQLPVSNQVSKACKPESGGADGICRQTLHPCTTPPGPCQKTEDLVPTSMVAIHLKGCGSLKSNTQQVQGCEGSCKKRHVCGQAPKRLLTASPPCRSAGAVLRMCRSCTQHQSLTHGQLQADCLRGCCHSRHPPCPSPQV